MKQHIRDLYQSGLSTRKVAKEVGVGFATVYRYCKDIIRSKSESLKGDKHPLYKGGHIDKLGYKLIWIDGKLCREHRVLMEKHLGRKLDRGEFVHHKDEDTSNNKLSNLEVMSNSEHTILHHKGKPSPMKGKIYPSNYYKKRICVKILQKNNGMS